MIFGLTVYISDPGLNTCVPESLSASSTCIACSIKVLPLLTSFCDWPAESGRPPSLLEGLFLLPHPFPQPSQQPVICLEQQRSWLSLSRGGLLLPTHISGDMVTLIAFLIPMPKQSPDITFLLLEKPGPALGRMQVAVLRPECSAEGTHRGEGPRPCAPACSSPRRGRAGLAAGHCPPSRRQRDTAHAGGGPAWVRGCAGGARSREPERSDGRRPRHSSSAQPG